MRSGRVGRFFLGADLGATSTRVLIASEDGVALGYGVAGPGNHEVAGHDGVFAAIKEAATHAATQAGVELGAIAGAGFGASGFDWPSDRPPLLATIARVGIGSPVALVNDALIGLIAGSSRGWGIGLVSGTGCNCWGRDPAGRLGRVSGEGVLLGEGAGSSELVARAVHHVNWGWTRRGPETALAAAMAEAVGAESTIDLLEGYARGRYPMGPELAPLVFRIAEEGDAVAREVVSWAGRELGELALAVARQLDMTETELEVVCIGGMFRAGELLLEPLRTALRSGCPGARLVPLMVPPAIGGLLLGMEEAGVAPSITVRSRLRDSTLQLVGAPGQHT